MDMAAVRFTAAAGLLRLARSHDDAVPVKLFHRLALTLQVITDCCRLHIAGMQRSQVCTAAMLSLIHLVILSSNCRTLYWRSGAPPLRSCIAPSFGCR